MAGESTPRSSLDTHIVEVQPLGDTNWYGLTDVDGYEIGRGEASTSSRRVAGMREKSEETEADPDTLTLSGPFQIGSKGVRIVNEANETAGATIKVRISLDGSIVDTATPDSSNDITVPDTGLFTLKGTKLKDFLESAIEGLWFIYSADTDGTTDVVEGSDAYEVERVEVTDAGAVGKIYAASGQTALAAKTSGNYVWEYPKRVREFTVRPTSKISESASAGELVEGTASFSIRKEGAITNSFKTGK